MHFKHDCDVFEWVGGDGDDVGELAGFDGANLVACADEFGGIDGGGDEAVFWGHACFVHVDEL